MIIEATALLGLPVITKSAVKLGTVGGWVFDGRRVGLNALRVKTAGRAGILPWLEVSQLGRETVISDSATLPSGADGVEQIARATGPVMGVVAKTEAGHRLGRISDLYLETESGLIVRFYVRNFLQDRLIPRQFLVAITPKEIIFKDVVETPVFDTVAAEAAAGG